MNKRRFRRAALCTVFVGLLIAGACGLSIWRLQHQEALNRALIAALVKNDAQKALALVNEGADPNSLYEASARPSIRCLWDSLMHHVTPRTPNNPSAFEIVCGKTWFGSHDETFCFDPDSPQLVLAMLQHEAKLEVKDEYGWTPLITAASGNRLKAVRVLLDYGANIDTKTSFGDTALMITVDRASPQMANLLLRYGANLNLRDETGQTVLQFAQDLHPNFVALLKQAGAKK